MVGEVVSVVKNGIDDVSNHKNDKFIPWVANESIYNFRCFITYIDVESDYKSAKKDK